MPSNPSDADIAAAMNAITARDGGLPQPDYASGEEADTGGVRQRGWIKRMLPQTMFGRSLLLIVLPLVLVQIIATWVFYGRHWETVSRRLSADTAGDIGMVIDAMKYADSQLELTRLLENSSGLTGIGFNLAAEMTLPPQQPAGQSMLEEQLRLAMNERVGLPYRMDAVSDPKDIHIQVQLAKQVLVAEVPRNRVYTSTTYVFVFWMIGSSLVLMSVAVVFLRNQVKSLRRLAAAADGFGKGRPVAFTKLEGALEVRQAAAAFMQMRDRIQRQIRQRTEILAGVSHDLRTPLTRMKLALAMMESDPTAAGLQADVAEMERLVDLYLDFARGEGTETPVETDISLLIEELAAGIRRDGSALAVDRPAELMLAVRPDAFRRCLTNLLGNARRYGRNIWLSCTAVEDGVDIVIDDDGPGIPTADRERVFQPFVRLDRSRNPSTGGIGLGLTIARDVARSHGGDVRLETSPRGGLRARVHLPK